MPLGELIGVGRTAEIFAWDQGRVIKLYRPGWSVRTAEFEAQVAAMVNRAGLAAPRFYERIELDGRQGIVYERLEGASMLHELGAHLWQLGRYARQFAALHAAMHACQEPSLHSQREGLRRQIERAPLLTDEQKVRIYAYLAALPDGEAICHGDLHPDNILMTAKGPVVIDWMTASRGNPLGDVARTTLMFRTTTMPTGSGSMLRLVLRLARRIFLQLYLRAYRRLRPFRMDEMEAWILPLAAARLAEGISSEEPFLLGIVNARLATLS